MNLASPAVTMSRLRSRRRVAAFTLVEMLVVIAIIGMLAAVGLPALKGFGQSNTIAAAQRQMLDDISAARQRAIAEHTEVYIVFMPHTNSSLADYVRSRNGLSPGSSTLQQVTNLLGEQYTSYALYTPRAVGDQPGRPVGRYLQINGRNWQTLPEGMFFKTTKFAFTNEGVSPFRTRPFPFPTATNAPVFLPYIQFNYLGQLVSPRDDGAEIIPLARGSIFYDPGFNPDPIENPRGNSSRTNTMYNWVRIDGLTGRARIDRYEMP